jgi:hypothetical protein
MPGWGTDSGLLALSPAPREHDDLLRMRIAERIHAYAWGFDERRVGVLRGCFTEDAVWHGSLAGREPVGPVHGADAIIEFLTAYWPRQTDQRRHYMLNLEVDPVTASEVLATTSLLLTAVEKRLEIVLTSFYRFRLVERGGRWLIADLFEGGDTVY